MVGVEIPLHGAGLDEGEGFELGAGDLDKFGIIALRGAALLVFFVHTLFRITPILYTHGNIKYQTLAHIKQGKNLYGTFLSYSPQPGNLTLSLFSSQVTPTTIPNRLTATKMRRSKVYWLEAKRSSRMTEPCMGCRQQEYRPVETNFVFVWVLQWGSYREGDARIFFRENGLKMSPPSLRMDMISRMPAIAEMMPLMIIGVLNSTTDQSKTGLAKVRIRIQASDEVILQIYLSQSGQRTQSPCSPILNTMSAMHTCCTKKEAQRRALNRQEGWWQGLASRDGVEKRPGIGMKVQ